MVRVGGGWVTLDEFLETNDPCRGMSNNIHVLVSIRLISYYDYLPFCTSFVKIKKTYFLSSPWQFRLIFQYILCFDFHTFIIFIVHHVKNQKTLWSLLLINVGRGEVSQPSSGCPLFLSSFQCIISLIYQDTLCTFIAPIVSKGIQSPLIPGILQYGNGVWVNAI